MSLAEPERVSLLKLHLIPIAVKGGIGAGIGYAEDYVQKEHVEPMLIGTPLEQLNMQVGMVNGVPVTALDAAVYTAAVLAAVMPAIFGRKDLTLTGAGAFMGKGYRQFGSSFGLPAAPL